MPEEKLYLTELYMAVVKNAHLGTQKQNQKK